MRTYFQIILFMLMVVAVASAETREMTHFEDIKDAEPDGAVEIFNIAGSIEVIGWDKEKIKVNCAMEENVERLDFDVRNGKTVIKVVVPDDAEDKTSADLKVYLPSASRLDIESISADIDISEVLGSIDAKGISGGLVAVFGDYNERKSGKQMKSSRKVKFETISGDISLNGDAGSVSVNSISGNIYLSGVMSKLTAASISGDVKVDGVDGNFTASTSSGDIHVNAGKVVEGNMEVMSGDIFLRGGLMPNCRVEASSKSGDIEFILTRDPEAEFKLKTISGEIDVDLDQEVPKVKEEVPGESLNFITGSGTGRIRVSTISGDIDIERD